MNALSRFVCAICSLAWSVVVMLNAYGLHIQSWSWLIWGTLGTLVLLAGAGKWSNDE